MPEELHNVTNTNISSSKIHVGPVVYLSFRVWGLEERSPVLVWSSCLGQAGMLEKSLGWTWKLWGISKDACTCITGEVPQVLGLGREGPLRRFVLGVWFGKERSFLNSTELEDYLG